MLYTREHAIETMNSWGGAGIPFFFIIDFEMKKIVMVRTDEKLPDNVCFDFHKDYSSDRIRMKIKKDFNKLPLDYESYKEAFKQVINQIKAGNSFLTNLTFPTPVNTSLTLRQIYDYSHAKYKVWLDKEFVCFSPETFITIKNNIIATFPMKGTKKEIHPDSEKLLLFDDKEIAEHYTVVDLLRNDLSMVAKNVSVKRFRYTDRISTNNGDILQVSSEISGILEDDYYKTLGNIIFTLLPAGSVTGAPKKKTLEIIKKVEKSDRGYYTGICGFFDGKNLDSAVIIRFIEIVNGEMYFRSGGGITFQSNAEDEYNELIDKVYVPVK